MNEYNIEKCNSVESFLSLAKKHGELICTPNGQEYDIVIANDGNNAKRDSFSKNFGFGKFPLHTDTAFWATPARILVMWSPDRSSAPTTMLPWNDILDRFSLSEKKALKDAIFIVKTFESSNYRAITFLSSGEIGYRYDPNIMFPANNHAGKFVEAFNNVISEINLINLYWSGSNALVLNNWNMLHGRSRVNNEHEKRRIFRAYVR